MNKPSTALLATKLFLVFFCKQIITPAYADTFDDISEAVREGEVNLSLRYRYEVVEQDSKPDVAHASTLKTRLGWKSGSLNGFFTHLEVDNVTAIGEENYNSTVNGNTNYPTVADPTGTDLNQAYLGYKLNRTSFFVGRQLINHNNQRFLGGVAWRQNEQTFDGFRALYKSQFGLSLDYSFVHNVNRLFGSKSPVGDLDGNLHLFNAKYAINSNHKFAYFAYDMDFDDANTLSNSTMGVQYDGKWSGIQAHLAYANQSESGDNPTRYSTDYYTIKLSGNIGLIKTTAGIEVLGADNGKGFMTPLGTLHKFQGLTDKFLNTPENGIEDIFVKGEIKVGKWKVAAGFHDFSSAENNISYGNEVNLTGKYPLANRVGLLLKYASYFADDFSSDTNKFAAQIAVRF